MHPSILIQVTTVFLLHHIQKKVGKRIIIATMADEASGTEAKKGPSKKELKKLAKKAEKEKAKLEKKKDTKKDGGAEASAANDPETAVTVTTTTTTTTTTTYWLDNVREGDVSSLKACVAAAASGISLEKGSSSNSNIPGFINGPVLASSDGAMVFGGNGICKALTSSKLSAEDQMKMEEWCEWERTVLRPNVSKPLKFLDELEEAVATKPTILDCGLSAADICIVSTLSQTKTALPEKVQAYVDLHCNSSVFQKGTEILKTLLPFDYATNPSLHKAVESVFQEAIATIAPSYDGDVKVSKCTNLKFGDYQCSASMPIFGILKKSGDSTYKSPQLVAAAIIQAIPDSNPVIDSMEVNGPGFILCRIKAEYLQKHIQTLSTTGVLQKPSSIKKEECVVDFSSPNIAKEMHVGHLRSTIIGESICRILEYVGCNVRRLNHVGDWGTQFGMLIQFLKEEYPDYASTGSGGTKGDSSIGDLTAFYKKAKVRHKNRNII